MPKLPNRRDVWKAYVEAYSKHRAGDLLTPEEEALIDKSLTGKPLVEGPWVLEVMDPEDEIDMGPHASALCHAPVKRIALKSGLPEEHAAFLMRHELGHSKSPGIWRDPYVLGVSTDDPKGEIMDDLRQELMADYYALTIVPDDEIARDNIAHNKVEAFVNRGLIRPTIDKLDELARKTVGFQGRSVTWRVQ